METKSLNENDVCFDSVYIEMRHIFCMEFSTWQSKGLLGYLEAIRPELKISAFEILKETDEHFEMNDQMKIKLIRMHLFKVMSYRYPEIAQYLALTRMRYGDKITFKEDETSSHDDQK